MRWEDDLPRTPTRPAARPAIRWTPRRFGWFAAAVTIATIAAVAVLLATY